VEAILFAAAILDYQQPQRHHVAPNPTFGMEKKVLDMKVQN
jgi:hypothetical protein